MPLAARLAPQFRSCPQSFASWPTVHSSDNLSAPGIIIQYTSRRKAFIYNIYTTKWENAGFVVVTEKGVNIIVDKVVLQQVSILRTKCF